MNRKNAILYLLLLIFLSYCSTNSESRVDIKSATINEDSLKFVLKEQFENDSISKLLAGSWELNESSLVTYFTDSNIVYLIDENSNTILSKSRFFIALSKSNHYPEGPSMLIYTDYLDSNGLEIGSGDLGPFSLRDSLIWFHHGGGFQHWDQWTFSKGLVYVRNKDLDFDINSLKYKK